MGNSANSNINTNGTHGNYINYAVKAENYTFVHDDIAPHIYAVASRAGLEDGEEVPITDILYGLI